MAASSKALPLPWIERLFARLSGLYGSKFADLWRGCYIESVKQTWAEGLADLTADEIRRGLNACMSREWPPTLPEFRKLCRPTLDPYIAYSLAHEAIDTGKLRETPTLYWAVHRFGQYDFRRLTWEQSRGRWQSIHADVLAEIASLPAPPLPLAAPEPLPDAPPEVARERLAEIQRQIAGLSEAKSA